MIGCLRTRVRKQPIIALYFESENELKLYNLEAWSWGYKSLFMLNSTEHDIYPGHKCQNANNGWHFNIYNQGIYTWRQKLSTAMIFSNKNQWSFLNRNLYLLYLWN